MSDLENSLKVLIMVGTRKGGLIFQSDAHREKWVTSSLHFKSWNVTRMILDPRTNRIHAAVVHDVYGPSTHYSDDLGRTWVQANLVPKFTRQSNSKRPLGTPDEAKDEEAARKTPEVVNKIWEIIPGRATEPGVLYAGIEPAALFKSTDNGETWQLIDSIYDHPHRSEWYPGAGGLGLHTILLDPQNSNRMYVAISTGGCYRSDDNGLTWIPCNKNVRADFLPDKFPLYGHCVHRMVLHPEKPQTLYQQNHCGVYRSDNFGDYWTDIGEGKLPSRFGFPIAIHPNQPDTIYVIPEESDDYRVSIDGKPVVWRSNDRGDHWKPLSNGLPKNAYLVILRQALATDTLNQTGIYFGTSTGQLFYSIDHGDNWQLLADFLPAILSVQVAVL